MFRPNLYSSAEGFGGGGGFGGRGGPFSSLSPPSRVSPPPQKIPAPKPLVPWESMLYDEENIREFVHQYKTQGYPSIRGDDNIRTNLYFLSSRIVYEPEFSVDFFSWVDAHGYLNHYLIETPEDVLEPSMFFILKETRTTDAGRGRYHFPCRKRPDSDEDVVKIRTFLQDQKKRYSIVANPQNGNCFLASIRDAYLGMGRCLSIQSMRYLAAKNVSTSDLESYVWSHPINRSINPSLTVANDQQQIRKIVETNKTVWSDMPIVKVLMEILQFGVIVFDTSTKNVSVYNTFDYPPNLSATVWMIVNYTGSHFECIMHDDRSIWNWEELPSKVKSVLLQSALGYVSAIKSEKDRQDVLTQRLRILDPLLYSQLHGKVDFQGPKMRSVTRVIQHYQQKFNQQRRQQQQSQRQAQIARLLRQLGQSERTGRNPGQSSTDYLNRLRKLAPNPQQQLSEKAFNLGVYGLNDEYERALTNKDLLSAFVNKYGFILDIINKSEYLHQIDMHNNTVMAPKIRKVVIQHKNDRKSLEKALTDIDDEIKASLVGGDQDEESYI